MKTRTKKYNKHKVFIIAEAGVNHNGNVSIAKKMIKVASQAGADAIKFQTFKAEKIVSAFAPKAEYQIKATGSQGSQLTMLRKVQLDKQAHKQLIDYCKKQGIIFISAPFDLESIDLLCEFGLEILKIPSGEITNLPYLRKIGRLKKKIILSTGMSNLAEIQNALRVIENAGTPLLNITVLHCNTEYPTPMEDVNLSAMLTIKEKFGVKVGYSDHTLGIEVPIAASALGATIIEKHFTLDKSMEGPDHAASLEPGELKAMVQAVRNIEKALGAGEKKPSVSEHKNIGIARKSIVANKDIRNGETFNDQNITVKRFGTGLNPMEWDKVIGRIAKRDFGVDELIEL